VGDQRPRLALALLLGAATTAVYLIGSGRVFGYDSAVTFANFIATPSLIDAFAVHAQQPSIPLAQIAGNDHVLVSLLSHLIYTLTSTRSEVVYRLLPALAGGGTVGVSAWALAKRFSLLAGASAGLFIAADPMFVDNSRDLRGYSLAALCAVIATVLFFMPDRFAKRRWLVLYGALLGLAIAAHAYAGLVLVAHILWVVSRRSWPELRHLIPAWALASVIAVAANGYILWVDATQHGFLPKLFDPTFPRDLVLYLLGAQSLFAIGLWLSAAGLGLFVVRRERLVWISIALLAATVLLLWLVVQPFYLYPRFFIFVIPGCAYLIAAAVKRWKVLAPVVLLGVVAAAVLEAPGYTADPLALRQAAAIVQRDSAQGKKVCLIHSDEQVLGAYVASGFSVVSSADQLATCDEVLVVSWGVLIPIRDQAAKEFPSARQLPAVYPTVVLER
jgi:hypothetical protein